MKIKTTTGEKDLLDILKWEDDYKRENITYENGSTKINIFFWSGFKEVYITVIESNLQLLFDTDKLTPEKINEFINLTLDWAGVTNEN